MKYSLYLNGFFLTHEIAFEFLLLLNILFYFNMRKKPLTNSHRNKLTLQSMEYSFDYYCSISVIRLYRQHYNTAISISEKRKHNC